MEENRVEPLIENSNGFNSVKAFDGFDLAKVLRIEKKEIARKYCFSHKQTSIDRAKEKTMISKHRTKKCPVLGRTLLQCF